MNSTPDDLPDSDSDRRLCNQLKKMELTAKYSAHFWESDSKLPPQIESRWLNNLEEFEKQFEKAKRTTVRKFVGEPNFKPLNEIPNDETEKELNDVLDFLELHNIIIDSVAGVPNRELYRFIIEELLDVETDDIRIEGMMHHFIYEEFHPNDEYDVKRDAEDFLSCLFWFEADLVSHRVAKEGVLDAQGKLVTHQQMLKAINDFRASFKSFERPKLEIVSFSLEGDNAEVFVQTEWTGLVDDQSPTIHKSGVSRLKLVRSSYGGWDVVQAIVPGWNYE